MWRTPSPAGTSPAVKRSKPSAPGNRSLEGQVTWSLGRPAGSSRWVSCVVTAGLLAPRVQIRGLKGHILGVWGCRPIPHGQAWEGPQISLQEASRLGLSPTPLGISDPFPSRQLSSCWSWPTNFPRWLLPRPHASPWNFPEHLCASSPGQAPPVFPASRRQTL